MVSQAGLAVACQVGLAAVIGVGSAVASQAGLAAVVQVDLAAACRMALSWLRALSRSPWLACVCWLR